MGRQTEDVKRKLKEALDQLDHLKEKNKHSEVMINTPPKVIEDCCCLSALECFRANLNFHFNTNTGYPKKLYKSLMNDLTIRGLNFCNTNNSSSSCPDCHSHPKERASEFFNRLESLIQRAIARIHSN